MYRVIGALCLMALPAHAETLLQQVTGTWTLTSGYEVAANGTKTAGKNAAGRHHADRRVATLCRPR
jgi:hypothetical protein